MKTNIWNKKNDEMKLFSAYIDWLIMELGIFHHKPTDKHKSTKNDNDNKNNRYYKLSEARTTITTTTTKKKKKKTIADNLPSKLTANKDRYIGNWEANKNDR